MSRTRPPTPAPGRPRSEQAQRAVLDAARAILQTHGYAAATIEAIAARAGVAKTTIYRWWPNRPAVLVDVVVELGAEEAPPAEGPDPMRAIRGEMSLVAVAMNGPLGHLITSLLAEAQHDPAVRALLNGRLFHPRTAAAASVIRRAQDEGAVRSDIPAPIVVDILFGPLFYRAIVQHEPVTEAFVKRVYESSLAGLAPVSRPTRPRAKSATAARIARRK